MNKTLTPIIHSDVRAMTDDTSLCHSLVDALGSPLNAYFPEIIGDTVSEFRSVLRKHHLREHLYFACKSCKSRAVLRQMRKESICADVASYGELKKALSCGFTGSTIEATGPKNRQFLTLALQHNCLISVDNTDELKSIVALHQELSLNNPVSILLRLSGFASNVAIPKDSRFGIPIETLPDAIKFLAMHNNIFAVSGVAFHLDTTAMQEKVAAIQQSLEALHSLQEAGFDVKILNIGGGFRMNYMENKTEWHAYIAALQEGVMGKAESLTWNNAGFGFRNEGGTLKGAPNFYDYAASPNGAEYLDALLESSLPQHNCTVGQYLSEHMIDLMLEPGRALLKHAGVTLAKVNFIKQSARGQTLVGLDMNRSNLSSIDQEMFLDPIVISRTGRQNENSHHGVYFVGNLCLEGDFVYKHKTFLSVLPEIGDIVCFVNTAAYNGDFEESQTLEQGIASKIAVVPKSEGMRWYMDDQYDPFVV